jgi:hypothetical protein
MRPEEEPAMNPRKRRMRVRKLPPVVPRGGVPDPNTEHPFVRRLMDDLSTVLDPRVFRALSHPSRRTILRRLHQPQGDAPHTAAALFPEGTRADRHYHTALLCDCEVIEKSAVVCVHPPVEPRFRSTVSSDPKVELILSLTALLDEHRLVTPVNDQMAQERRP